MSTTTPRWQRIAIWIIAIAMIVGTVAGLIFMVLATQDSKIDPNSIASEEATKRYQEEYQKQLDQMAEERKKLRAFDYADKVTPFDADSVTELSVETIKEGDGATISRDDSLKVNYTGWTPDGKIFDSTKKSEDSDPEPTTFALSSLIEGWANGLEGKKVGGVYLLTIPADQAYGEIGSGDGSIGANTPIKFLIQVISIEKDDSK